mgnify:CR=1 FL=1
MQNQLSNGNVYSFTTINPNVLGASFHNAKLDGTLTYDVARLLEPSLDALHAQVKTSLPAGVSTKHTNYSYYAFKTETGTMKIIASEWILPSSIIQVTTDYLDIRISGANSSRLAEVRAVLGGAGFSIVNEIA